MSGCRSLLVLSHLQLGWSQGSLGSQLRPGQATLGYLEVLTLSGPGLAPQFSKGSMDCKTVEALFSIGTMGQEKQCLGPCRALPTPRSQLWKSSRNSGVMNEFSLRAFPADSAQGELPRLKCF